MVAAWLITLPAAGLVGAAMWGLGHVLGGYAGPLAVFAVLAVLASVMWVRSQRQPVHPGNVNDEWSGTPGSSARREEVAA
jgi:PiT family inorganic phosphate transporter